MSKWVMFGAWVWILACMLSAVMSGSYIGATQQGVLDKLQGFTVWHISGFAIPLINVQFFDGVISLFQPGNAMFLGGDNPLILFIYIVNIGVIIGFLTLFANILWGFVRR